MARRSWIAPLSIVLAAAVAVAVVERPVAPQSSPQSVRPAASAAQPVAAADAADTADTADAADVRRVSAAPPSVAPPASVPTAGLRAHVDPETGRFVPEPPPGAAVESDLVTADAMSTRSVDLVELPSSVPGGGVMLDLGGRFQSAIEMSIDESGALSSDCATDEAPPAAAGDQGMRR